MKAFKNITLAALLGLISADEFVPEASNDLFKLEEDALVIDTSKGEKADTPIAYQEEPIAENK